MYSLHYTSIAIRVCYCTSMHHPSIHYLYIHNNIPMSSYHKFTISFHLVSLSRYSNPFCMHASINITIPYYSLLHPYYFFLIPLYSAIIHYCHSSFSSYVSCSVVIVRYYYCYSLVVLYWTLIDSSLYILLLVLLWFGDLRYHVCLWVDCCCCCNVLLMHV